MLLARLVETSVAVAATSRRLEKIERLGSFLKQLRPDEVPIAVSYLSGEMPQGKVGIGYRTLAGVPGSPAIIPTIELTELDQALDGLAKARGRQLGELLYGIMSKATEAERRFLSALLTGELRQGALEGIMLDAVSRAAGIPIEKVRRAVMMAGGLAAVAEAVFVSGESGLARFCLRLFQPLQPMLAQTAEDVSAALSDLGEAALEFKLDGARVQVHRAGDEVRVFTRGFNEVTAAVPEIVEATLALPVREIILDGEALSLQKDGRPQPFQMTMRRFGRKLEVDRVRAELPLSPFWFDVLYLNGGDLLDESQQRRFAELARLAPETSLIPHARVADVREGEEFLRRSLDSGHEGIMAKAPSAPYAAGARGQSWLKIKRAHTLDLVVLAAEWGSGRRKGWLSNLHLGAVDTEKGGFAMLGKTFKGLTDEVLAWQTQELLKIEIARDSYTVYVEPKLVVEIAFNDVQISPTYESGHALRFARVKRYRTDKLASDADTFATV